jgi:pyrroline-5-carboxylate reductase
MSTTIALLGVGKLGEALLSGLLRSGTPPSRCWPPSATPNARRDRRSLRRDDPHHPAGGDAPAPTSCCWP